jgi:hypothetical protein
MVHTDPSIDLLQSFFHGMALSAAYLSYSWRSQGPEHTSGVSQGSLRDLHIDFYDIPESVALERTPHEDQLIFLCAMIGWRKTWR